MRFASKRAVVTGATGAIGGAIASALSDEGAEIDVVSRQEPRGAQYGWHIVDLVEDPDIEAKAAAIANEFDRLDLLIHSAGHYSLGHLR
ncbi:MAG: SDR family NAD(P)-dependent oxidoreductase, partial [Pseudomonadota bacterium]